jgi:hypothetical protein
VSLVDLVLAVDEALDHHGVAHAFGGALALAYVGEPRFTVDVDVNVFVPVSGLVAVVGALGSAAVRPTQDDADWVPTAGVRFVHEVTGFPVDVFPSVDPEVYGAVQRRVVRRPFGPEEAPLPFLSAEDLVVFKLSFGRDKDWVDLRAMIRTGVALDLDYVEAQVIALRGPSLYPRLARLRGMVRAGAP